MTSETPIHDELVDERRRRTHPPPTGRPPRHRWTDEPPTEPIPHPTGRHQQ